MNIKSWDDEKISYLNTFSDCRHGRFDRVYDHAYPEYVSANNYQSYDCVALANEYTRVNQYVMPMPTSAPVCKLPGIGIGVSGNRHGIYPTVSVGGGSINGGNRHNLSIAMGQRDAMLLV